VLGSFVAKARICTLRLGTSVAKPDHLMEKPTVFDKEGEAMLNDSEQSEAGMRPRAPKMQIT